METYVDVVADCERRTIQGSMNAAIDTMHQLDPPPPDVLLALLARNKALEGKMRVHHVPTYTVKVTNFYIYL